MSYVVRNDVADYKILQAWFQLSIAAICARHFFCIQFSMQKQMQVKRKKNSMFFPIELYFVSWIIQSNPDSGIIFY